MRRLRKLLGRSMLAVVLMAGGLLFHSVEPAAAANCTTYGVYYPMSFTTGGWSTRGWGSVYCPDGPITIEGVQTHDSTTWTEGTRSDIEGCTSCRGIELNTAIGGPRIIPFCVYGTTTLARTQLILPLSEYPRIPSCHL